MPDSDQPPDDQPQPAKLPPRKRGAIPTPRTEIEKAKPYVPETDPPDDRPDAAPPTPE